MYFINGEYHKEEDAKISVLDLSILRGYGVFDYLRTYQGKPFHLRDHLLRLQYSAQELHLQLPYSLPELETIINKVIELAGLVETSIKIVLTGGISPDQFLPQQPTLIVFAYPLTIYPMHLYETGIKVITTKLTRALPTSKTIQYIPGIVALQKGRADNPQDALYLNAQNEILEATTSNFFGVKNDTLYTCCSEEVLTGITREVILKFAKRHFPIKLEAIPYDEIGDLSEAFLTSSNREVMPVSQIDTQQIGNGKPGPITREIIRLFADYTSQEIWPDLNIPRYHVSELC